MAERKATNKYYPPEWTPAHGSINKFRNSHPLRDRAKKISEGILRIRFEMPFNVWCLSCNSHIGKGVRYNADKKKVDKYYSTDIFEFRMTCHLCSGEIVMRTDPENRDFACHEGVRKVALYVPSEGDGSIVLPTAEEKQKIEQDPFLKLEKQNEDLEKARKSIPQLEALMEKSDSRSENYKLSSQLRRQFRGEKKELLQQKLEGEELGLGAPLLPLQEKDRQEMKNISFRKSNPDLLKKQDSLLFNSSSIFKNRHSSNNQPSTPEDTKQTSLLSSPNSNTLNSKTNLNTLNSKTNLNPSNSTFKNSTPMDFRALKKKKIEIITQRSQSQNINAKPQSERAPHLQKISTPLLSFKKKEEKKNDSSSKKSPTLPKVKIVKI